MNMDEFAALPDDEAQEVLSAAASQMLDATGFADSRLDVMALDRCIAFALMSIADDCANCGRDAAMRLIAGIAEFAGDLPEEHDSGELH